MTRITATRLLGLVALVVIFLTCAAAPPVAAQDLDGADDLGDIDLGEDSPAPAASPSPDPSPAAAGPGDPGELPGDPGELPPDPGSLPGDPSELPGDPGDLPGELGNLPDGPPPIPVETPAKAPAPRVVARDRFLTWIGKTVRRLDERQLLMRSRYDRGAANTLRRAFELRGIRSPVVAGYADAWGRDELSPAWAEARDFYKVHREALEKSARSLMAREESDIPETDLTYLEEGIRAWRVQEIVLEKFLEDLVQIYTGKAVILEKVEKLKGERFSPLFAGDLTYEQRIEGFKAQADLKQSQADRLVARLGDLSGTTRLFSPLDEPQRIIVPGKPRTGVEPRTPDPGSGDPLESIDIGEPGDPGTSGDPGTPGDPGDPGTPGDPGDPGGSGGSGGSDDLDSIDLGDDLGEPGGGTPPSPAAVAETPPSPAGGGDLEGDLDLDPLDIDEPGASPAAAPPSPAPSPTAPPSPAAPASPAAAEEPDDLDIDLEPGDTEEPAASPAPSAAPSVAAPAPASSVAPWTPPSAAPSAPASPKPADDADDMDIDLEPGDLGEAPPSPSPASAAPSPAPSAAPPSPSAAASAAPSPSPSANPADAEEDLGDIDI